MSSKRIIPLFMAGFLIFSGVQAFATGIVNPTASSGTTSSSSSSSVVTDSVCDPEIYSRMKEKARMEAQRENYVNQSIITPPASLFDLNCFNKQLGQTKKNLGLGVGESNDKTGFNNTVDSIAGNSSPYSGPVDSNGKPIIGVSDDNKNITTDDKLESSPSESSDSKCAEMQKLWQETTCGNFAGGNLPSLKETGSENDARKYSDGSSYKACEGGKDDPRDSELTFANGQTNIYSPMANLKNAQKTSLFLCKYRAFSELAGLKCQQQSGQNDLCWPGEKTGQKVNIGGALYDGINCSNPGCSPQVSGSELKCTNKQN